MKQLFQYGGEFYVILREIKVSTLSNRDGSLKGELFNAWKDFLGADKVLKKDGIFVFCETVQEANWEDV
jgi:hypothetical protein